MPDLEIPPTHIIPQLDLEYASENSSDGIYDNS